MAYVDVLFQYLFGFTEENHDVSQYSRSPYRDLIWRPAENDARLLPTHPRRSVTETGPRREYCDLLADS